MHYTHNTTSVRTVYGGEFCLFLFLVIAICIVIRAGSFHQYLKNCIGSSFWSCTSKSTLGTTAAKLHELF
jgi:predicted membrane-bound dolichyl-phosphate-mannose-protein mannosyltransferase